LLILQYMRRVFAIPQLNCITSSQSIKNLST
jgi:hypothetical protein